MGAEVHPDAPRVSAELPGFSVPVHHALTEHILLGGAPRSIAILNGTLAAALGLRLWLVGGALGAIGHLAALVGGVVLNKDGSLQRSAHGSNKLRLSKQ